jgi:hypothetical protein
MDREGFGNLKLVTSVALNGGGGLSHQLRLGRAMKIVRHKGVRSAA